MHGTQLIRRKGKKVGSPDAVTAKAGRTLKREKPTVKTYALKVPTISRDQTVRVGIDVAAKSMAICVLGP